MIALGVVLLVIGVVAAIGGGRLRRRRRVACSASPSTTTSPTTRWSARSRRRTWRARPAPVAADVEPGTRRTTELSADSAHTRADEHDDDRPDPAAPTAPFGSVFGSAMAVPRFDGEAWSDPEVVDVDTSARIPAPTRCTTAARASRASRRTASRRTGRHVPTRRARGAAPAERGPPVPAGAVGHARRRPRRMTVDANEAVAPSPPGSLYLRPTLLGTDVTIGAAAHPSATASCTSWPAPR